MSISFLNKKIYFFWVIVFVLSILAIFSYALYQVMPKPLKIPPPHTPPFEVYILKSTETLLFFKDSKEIYTSKIQKLYQKFKKTGFTPKIITQNDILTIPEKSVVISPDTYDVSKKTFEDIKKFIKKGGTFIFNFHFGYFKKSLYNGPKKIEKLTRLKFVSEEIPNKETRFYVPHLLSPLTLSDLEAKREYLVLYGKDTIPFFKSDCTPDLVLTNWAVTSTPFYKNRRLNINESGLAWHGFLEKGKWFYFSFPSYVFLDMKDGLFKKFFARIISYSKKPVLSFYPFIDTKKAVFISEDTEFKYENMINFAKLAKEYNISATLFCVAKLAKKHPAITKEASTFPNIEIASHSYSHTKIIGEGIEKIKKEIVYSKKVLEEITGKKIYGFRPPREQIDKTIEEWLIKANYKYVMEKTKPFLIPKDLNGLTTIPRHGSDDYLYIIGLNWDKDQILNNIIKETTLLTTLNALYTLSVHTHLLSYKTNIEIIEKYFQYLKKHPQIKALKGIELQKRAQILKNLSYKVQNNKIIITSKKPVKVLKFKIFYSNSFKITKGDVKIIKHNKKRRFIECEIKNLNSKAVLEYRGG